MYICFQPTILKYSFGNSAYSRCCFNLVPAAFVIALKIAESFFELHIVILMQASIKDLTSVTIYSGNKFAMDTEETKETFFYQT